MLDILFWKKLFDLGANNNNIIEDNLIIDVCEYMSDLVPGLIKLLKFQIFTRTPRHPDEAQAMFDYE